MDTHSTVQRFTAIAKALGDENRVGVLLFLREGELCLCQIIELLQLAPSTVSKHVDVLRRAGLVTMRKQGRWRYYRLAGPGAPAAVREALRWTLRSLDDRHLSAADTSKLSRIRASDPQDFTACYTRS